MTKQAVELVEGYRTGAISPVEATQEALDAIERYDEKVNAFVLVDAEGALAAAKESEARWHTGEPLGPGDGVPTSIKDALWTRGWPTLRGSTLIDEAQPWDEDAPVRGAAAGDGRGDPRQDDDAGVLVEGRHRLLEVRRDRQSVGSVEDVGRIQWRFGDGGRPGDGSLVGRYGRRRVGPDPGRFHRDGRAQTDVRADPAVPAECVRHVVARRAR